MINLAPGETYFRLNRLCSVLAARGAVAGAPLMDWIMSPSSGQAIIGWGQYECILHSGRSVSMSHYLTTAPSPTKGSCKSNLVQDSARVVL